MSETINDSYLGMIKRDFDSDEYQGQINNKEGEVVEFRFDVNDNIQEVVKGVRQIIKNYCDNSSKFKLHAAEKLLDLYNDTWSEDEVINHEEFIDRITLNSISIYSDENSECSAEVYYTDGDLFAGHYIAIDIDSEGQLGDAYLVG